MIKKDNNKRDLTSIQGSPKNLFGMKKSKIAGRGAFLGEKAVESVSNVAAPPQHGEAIASQAELDRQSETTFSQRIKFSVLVPLFNTPENYLREMIQSVLDQTYSNFELCLADGSDKDHEYVQRIWLEYEKNDKRIKYKHLAKNMGISENTNACIEMSEGEYIALLDHDDCLNPSALYEVMQVICAESADMIYTDEAKFEKDVKRYYSPNFKPDFAKDDLRAHNYICHLTVFSRELLKEVGGFNSRYDGSQDHDMVLRLSERARKIVHIPKILYFWRVHSGSVSSDIGAKSYAVDAAHRAVKAQMDRTGEKGKIMSIPPYQSLYKADYDIIGEPMVSVIIYRFSNTSELNECIRSVEDMSTWYPMEIFIVDNGIDLSDHIRKIPTIKPVTILKWSNGVDFNEAVSQSRGQHIVFLDAAAVLESSDWVREMLMYSQRKDVGAVGAKIYGKKAVISAGLALDGGDRLFLHRMFQGARIESHGYEAGLCHVRDVTALDAICMMVSKEKLAKVGDIRKGFGSYVFVDLCLRFREMGLVNVCTPFVRVKYIGNEIYKAGDGKYFYGAWKNLLEKGDQYYNPNIKLQKIF